MMLSGNSKTLELTNLKLLPAEILGRILESLSDSDDFLSVLEMMNKLPQAKQLEFALPFVNAVKEIEFTVNVSDDKTSNSKLNGPVLAARIRLWQFRQMLVLEVLKDEISYIDNPYRQSSINRVLKKIKKPNNLKQIYHNYHLLDEARSLFQRFETYLVLNETNKKIVESIIAPLKKNFYTACLLLAIFTAITIFFMVWMVLLSSATAGVVTPALFILMGSWIISFFPTVAAGMFVFTYKDKIGYIIEDTKKKFEFKPQNMNESFKMWEEIIYEQAKEQKKLLTIISDTFNIKDTFSLQANNDGDEIHHLNKDNQSIDMSIRKNLTPVFLNTQSIENSKKDTKHDNDKDINDNSPASSKINK